MRRRSHLRLALGRLRRHLLSGLQAHQLRKVRRGVQEVCWCGGSLAPFVWHSSFGVCTACGSFVNRRPPLLEDLPSVYSLRAYWRTRQRMKGFPTIEARIEAYRQDGRLQKWIELATRFKTAPARVIEVGCAPGVLLHELRLLGYECIGVEVEEETASWIRQQLPLDIRVGVFPWIELPPCDLFLAFDVLEHSHRPLEFMSKVFELLSPGGVAVIQSVVERYGFSPPFGERFDVFDDVEHAFLFTNRAMELLASRCGLEVVSLDQRVFLAGEICIFRRP